MRNIVLSRIKNLRFYRKVKFFSLEDINNFNNLWTAYNIDEWRTMLLINFNYLKKYYRNLIRL